MANYVVAIGGTGAKILRAVTHVAATGLFNNGNLEAAQSLFLLFVEPDRSNGNLSATTTTLQAYQNCYGLFRSNNHQTWMSTRIQPDQQPNIWSLFVDNRRSSLREIFQESLDRDQPTRHLFDVLFTHQEQAEVLDTKGFKGRPAVGAAVINQVMRETASQKSWRDLLNEIEKDQNARVILCGSIFGGTGAAGLPMIAQQLKKCNPTRLDAILMLPYFTFSEKTDVTETEIYVKAKEFPLRTRAALDYYQQKASEVFNATYLLGTPKLAEVPPCSGGQDQKNPPLFLELYAALAVRDAFRRDDRNGVILLSRPRPSEVNWDALPDRGTVRHHLLNATIFALIWLQLVVPSIKDVRKSARCRVPWINQFFSQDALKSDAEWQTIQTISAWCQDYWDWLKALHQSVPGVNIIEIDAFLERDNLKSGENLGDQLLKTYRIHFGRDVLEKLNRHSVKGNQASSAAQLANALYPLCQPKG
jgi:hypothetical protein